MSITKPTKAVRGQPITVHLTISKKCLLVCVSAGLCLGHNVSSQELNAAGLSLVPMSSVLFLFTFIDDNCCP